MLFTFPRTLLAATLALSFSLPAYGAEPHKQIQQQPTNKAEALKLLERLVNIDSGSGYEPGLTQVRDIAVDELKQLGFTIELVPDKAANNSHVVATLKGHGKGQDPADGPYGHRIQGRLGCRSAPSTSRTAAPTAPA